MIRIFVVMLFFKTASSQIHPLRVISFRALRRIHHRKMEDHYSSAIDFARDAHSAAHVFHHAFDEIEAEAHTAYLIVPYGLDSIKRLEDMREVRGRNSYPFVFHADPHFWFRIA